MADLLSRGKEKAAELKAVAKEKLEVLDAKYEGAKSAALGKVDGAKARAKEKVGEKIDAALDWTEGKVAQKVELAVDKVTDKINDGIREDPELPPVRRHDDPCLNTPCSTPY
jgi:hypothetical protein